MNKQRSCVYCGQKLEKEVKYCEMCGKEQPQTLVEKQKIKCIHCGQELPGGARYCFSCGTLQVGAKDEMKSIVKTAAEQESVHKLEKVPTERKPTENAVSATEEQPLPREVGKQMEKAKETAQTAWKDFSKKMKDANLAEQAKQTTKSAMDDIQQEMKKEKDSGKSRKKGKKKVEFFDVETIPNEDAARQIIEKNNAKLKRGQIGMILAVIATIGMQIALRNEGDYPLLAAVGWITMLISYILAGGILKAIKAAIKLAKIGWMITPVPAIDICIAAAGLMIGVVLLVSVPIVFVVLNYLETRKNIEQAELYLGIIRK